MTQRRATLTITAETRDRLQQIADEQHTTMAGLITKWAWDVKTAGRAPARGQQKLDLAKSREDKQSI